MDGANYMKLSELKMQSVARVIKALLLATLIILVMQPMGAQGSTITISSWNVVSVSHPSLPSSATAAGEIIAGGYKMYCTNLHVSTTGGVTYSPGNNVNIPQIIYILNNYYPVIPNKPSGLTTPNDISAAVQLAIWHYSDGIDISSSGSGTPLNIFNAARAIIADADSHVSIPTYALSFDQQSAINSVGEIHTIKAKLTQDGVAVANKQVSFSVSGANSATGSASTDTYGNATFSYTGTTEGTDTITATAASITPVGLRWVSEGKQDLIMAGQYPLSNTATKRWVVALCSNYAVALVGSSYDIATGRTTFTYHVSASSDPEISHWVLKLDPCISSSDVFKSGSVSGSPSVNGVFENLDPTTGIRGIKFESPGVTTGGSRDFYIILNGYWPQATGQAAIKTGKLEGSGTKVCYYEINGPKCLSDLYVTKRATTACDEISYSIEYGNRGTDRNTNVKVIDDYDQNKVTVKPGTITGGGTDDGDKITWSIGVLQARDYPYTISYAVSVKPGLSAGTKIVNEVVIQGDQPESSTENNKVRVEVSPIVSPTVDVGSDKVDCKTSIAAIAVSGTVSNAASVLWTTSGTGTFAAPTSAVTTYTASDADKAAASGVTLTLTAIGTMPCTGTAEDSLVLMFEECEQLGVTVANVAICPGTAASLTAIVTGCIVTSYQWYIGDSPSGEMIPDTNSPTYQTTNEGSYTCEVTCDDERKSYGFGTVSLKECEIVVGSISGTKFEDENGNALWDEGETGLGEWIINLLSQDGEVFKTATTSSDQATLGSYSIDNIPPGTYTLEEVPSFSSDWTQTYPADNIYTVVVSETGQVTVTRSDQTVVASTDANFGNEYTGGGGQKTPLEVTKATPAEILNPNTQATFTITVKNIGKIEIHDISIVDELSPMLEFIPYAYSGNTLIQHTIDGSNLIFDLGPLGSLQPGDSWTITYNVKLSPEACSAASTLTTLPPVITAEETKLKVMAAGSEPVNMLQMIDSLSRNKTKLEAKLESIKKQRDIFDKANATLESGTQSIAGMNYTLNNYTNISTGETLNEELNATTGFLVLSEYTRPDKYDLLVTTYGTKGEVLSDFYNFLPTKETLKIEYDKPEKGYKTYTVRYYATGDTLIMTVDSYGNVVSREYRRTPGLAEPQYLTNCATSYGNMGEQDESVESNRACVDLAWSCQSGQPVLGLRVFKEADREVAREGDTIKYKYTVENTGTIVLDFLTLNDDKLGIIVLNDPDPLDPGESRTYYAYYIVKNGDGPILKNTVVASALDPDGLEVVSPPAREEVKILTGCGLTKTASPKVVKPGDYVTYNITWDGSTSGDQIVDDYPRGVSFISASPTPIDDGNNNRWNIDGMVPGTIIILMQVAQDIGNTSFDMGQGVTGTGFVNVHNDIRTNPVILTNKATLFEGKILKCTAFADVNIGPPQTYVALKEHGSGDYASEDVIKYQNSNRSIEWNKSLTATHKPTTFSLPNNRDIDFKSKWIEKAKSKNYATGASTNEEYTYANRINRNSSLKLDENGSTMKTETDFEGVGHIGLLKKDADANRTWNASTVFEASEDYVGSFKINEKFDEYGKNAEYEKSVTGTGYVSANRDLGKAQSSYESGTGKYQSEERISTVVNYIAKDINLTYLPTSYSYTPTFSTSSDLKWNEGMWSKTPTSMISEQFSSATDLNLQSTARGLNEMVTEANVTGQADFRTVYKDNSHNNSAGEIDQDETYVGQFDIQRKTTLGGVAKYDRPHLSLSKAARVDMLNTTFADYRITIENNGNQALGPVYVKDVFPTGTEYITSSLRPAELTTSYANWSLPFMGIGSKVIIDLRLNITEEPSNLVNRVEAAGKYRESWTLARNFSVVRLNWLTCCPPQISATKTAKVDALDPNVVWYSLSLKNREKYTMVAFLMDQLPLPMQLLNSSLEPSENRSNLITWTFLDLAPGESRAIVYRARALKDGVYVNVAHIEAFSVDGPDGAVADVEARVDLGKGGALPSSISSDWQPPTCFGLNCSGQIYSEDWVPCYTCGTGEPGNAVVLPSCASCMSTGDDSLP